MNTQIIVTVSEVNELTKRFDESHYQDCIIGDFTFKVETANTIVDVSAPFKYLLENEFLKFNHEDVTDHAELIDLEWMDKMEIDNQMFEAIIHHLETNNHIS